MRLHEEGEPVRVERHLEGRRRVGVREVARALELSGQRSPESRRVDIERVLGDRGGYSVGRAGVVRLGDADRARARGEQPGRRSARKSPTIDGAHGRGRRIRSDGQAEQRRSDIDDRVSDGVDVRALETLPIKLADQLGKRVRPFSAVRLARHGNRHPSLDTLFYDKRPIDDAIDDLNRTVPRRCSTTFFPRPMAARFAAPFPDASPSRLPDDAAAPPARQ